MHLQGAEGGKYLSRREGDGRHGGIKGLGVGGGRVLLEESDLLLSAWFPLAAGRNIVTSTQL